MDGRARLIAAVLAGVRGHVSATVVIEDSLRERPDLIDLPRGEYLAVSEISRELERPGFQASIVVLRSLDGMMLRKLRAKPPALVVLVDADPDSMRSSVLDQSLVLGPQARLKVDLEGSSLACAESPQALQALIESLDDKYLVAACPTPPWWPDLLRDPGLADNAAIGFVAAQALGDRWLRLEESREVVDTLVPLDLPSPCPEEANEDELIMLVAGHQLERATGPVFPDPRVVVALHGARRTLHDDPDAIAAELASSDKSDKEQQPEAWTQAQRALPEHARGLDFQHLHPTLAQRPTPIAFLAQRPLMRALEPEIELDAAAFELHASPDSVNERSLQVLQAAPEILTEHESKVVLKGAGFEITRQAVANSASGAAQFADRIGYPVALKALSPDLRRKDDIGAVILDVPNAASARRAYADIIHNVETRMPNAHLDGIIVAEMIEAGPEFVCGALRMPNGEVAHYVRAIGLQAPVETSWGLSDPPDTQTFPAARRLAQAAFARLPQTKMRRGSDPDTSVLAEVFARLTALFAATGERLVRVDLAPLRLVEGERGHVVLDARIVQLAHLEGE